MKNQSNKTLIRNMCFVTVEASFCVYINFQIQKQRNSGMCACVVACGTEIAEANAIGIHIALHQHTHTHTVTLLYSMLTARPRCSTIRCNSQYLSASCKKFEMGDFSHHPMPDIVSHLNTIGSQD